MAKWSGRITRADADHMQSMMLVRLLQYAVDNETYVDVLHALIPAIRASGKRVDDAAEEGDQDFLEIVLDNECPLVEGLLGAAFIVCQTAINGVASAAEKARTHAAKWKGGAKPSSMAKAIRAEGATFSSSRPDTSSIEAIWGVANYFKHRDEWEYQWKGAHADTLRIIELLGLDPTSNGNLRTASEALGNDSYDQMEAFIRIIRDWSNDVLMSTAKMLDIELRR